MRKILAFLAPVLVAALGGCFSEETVIKVKADGSGTIVVTTKMKSAKIKEFQAMMEGFAPPGEQGKEKPIFTEEQARAKAAKYGEGVEFVSSEKLTGKDEEGIKATYSFKDITKVRFEQKPDSPLGEMPASPDQKPEKVTFKLEKSGGNVILTAVSPAFKPKEGEEEDKKVEEKEKPDPGQVAMMKQFLGGMKFGLVIEVAGKIVKTNAPHVNGSAVTVLEMDFDALLSDEAQFLKLAEAQPKTIEEAKRAMKDVKGIKVCFDPELKIEFTPQ